MSLDFSLSLYFIFIVCIVLFLISLFFNFRLTKLAKKNKKELEEERMFLNNALEATKTNINVTDLNFNLRYVDPFWQKIYGNPEGRKCYEYFMKKDCPCTICGMPEAMKLKKTIIYEETMPSENNRVVEVHTIPFQDASGEWLFAEFNVDITRRKRAEDALNNALRLESLGILAGGIAHDFNNLLSGIFGNITIASGIIKNKEAINHLSVATSSIERARYLTSQLLTFAKGGAPIKKIESFIPFLEETVRFALSDSKISCLFEISNDLYISEFDRNQIGQVIENLLINAKHAVTEKGIVEISAKNTFIPEDNNKDLSAGKYVVITVKDSGTGIPKKFLPKIFDPFFTTKPNGAGLGLSTSYSIIKRHSGHIEVQSEEGVGTSFSIYLPATEEELPLQAEPVLNKHQGKGLFIVMDDQEIIRTITGKMLENFGYSVVLTENGESALKYFSDNCTNVKGMIFDLTIPGGMGGLEAVSKIREINKDVPVFVSSGYAEDPVMSDPQKYGFTGSISKPFMKDELIKILNKHLL